MRSHRRNRKTRRKIQFHLSGIARRASHRSLNNPGGRGEVQHLSESAGPKAAHDGEIRDPAGEAERQANPELNGIIAQQKMEFLQTPSRKRIAARLWRSNDAKKTICFAPEQERLRSRL